MHLGSLAQMHPVGCSSKLRIPSGQVNVIPLSLLREVFTELACPASGLPPFIKSMGLL